MRNTIQQIPTIGLDALTRVTGGCHKKCSMPVPQPQPQQGGGGWNVDVTVATGAQIPQG